MIGRDTELQAIASWLARISEGATALVIEGEAGIGKTTLVSAGLAAAGERARVLLAHPTQAEERLSFVGLSDLLGSVGDDVIDTLPPPQRDALEVALLRKEAETRPPDPRTVGAATLSCLRALAQDGPVVVAVDDIQWADKATARTLAFALRRLGREPVGALISRRAAPGGPAPLGLDRAPFPQGLHRLAVEGLACDAVRALLETHLGWVPSRSALARLNEVCGGNPLFALELARALQGHGEVAPGDPLPVPERLRDLVRERLRGIDAPHRDVLLHAAALGNPTLQALQEATGEGVLDALESAQAAGLAERRGQVVVFAHPLYASVLYASTRASKRRAVHATLATIVADAEERARHLALTATGPDEEVAAALEQAAHLAFARGAPDAAAELAEMAREATPPGDRDAAARRGLQAANHHWTAGNPAAARAVLDRVESGDPPPTARANLLAIRAWTELYEIGPLAAIPLLEAARAILDDSHQGSTRDSGANLLLLGFCELHAARPIDPAITHLERALNVFQARGEATMSLPGMENDELAAQTKLFLQLARYVGGRGIEREVLDQGPAIDSRSPALFWRGMLLIHAGDHDAARGWLEALRDRLIQLGGDRDLMETLHHLAELDWREGGWEASRHLAEEALELAVEFGQVALGPLPASYVTALAAARGDFDEARELGERWSQVADASGYAPFIGFTGWARGFTALCAGDDEAVVAILDPLRDRLAGFGWAEPAMFMYHGDLIEALIRTGRVERAEEVLAELEERSATNMGGGWACAVALRCRELLSAARGELDGALAVGDEALAAAETIPIPFERARTWLVHGTVLRRAKHKRAARETLERAGDAFAKLGATVWVARAAAELDRVGVRPETSLELTPTEERVANLVADGLRNQQIAAAMSISVRTVEANLTRVYRKLGVERRSELVRHFLAMPK